MKLKFFISLFLLVSIHLFAQDYTDSLKSVLKKNISDSLRIEVLNELSWEYAPIRFDESIMYAKEALKLSKNKFPVLEASAYNRLGTAYDIHGEYANAIENYTLCYNLRNKLKDTLGASNALLNIGAAYYFQGFYNKALEYYAKTTFVKEEINDFKGLSQAYNNIGLIYRVKKEYNQALSYFHRSLEFKKKLGDVKGEINTLSNLGIIYQNVGNCDKAIEYAINAYNLSLKVNSDYDIASALTNLGFAYKCNKEYKRALSYFKESEEKLLQNNDIQTLAFCFKGIGEVYLELKEYDNALASFKKAIEFGIQAGRNELLSDIYRLKSETYKYLNNTHKAFENYQKYISYRDTVFSSENTRQLNELETIFETEQKQKQIDLLTQESLIKEQQAENNKLLRNLFIVISLSILVILILVLFVLKQKQKSNSELDSKNKLIEQSLNEKEMLLREIHHRVKNNLQIITGLLELQESLQENKEIGSLVSEAQGRIKSMALIHEMLYQTTDLSSISLKDYVAKLVDSIESGFAAKNIKVNKKYDLENVVLNIDTIIPLGLIINELVSNAYKYVFSINKGSILKIKIENSEGHLKLIIADDGPGVPNNGEGLRTGSFGLKLVKMLSRQLKGKTVYNFNQGAEFTINFMELNHKI